MSTLFLLDDFKRLAIISEKHQGGLLSDNVFVTPPHIVPEWYFLPFYSALRSMPDKALGIATAMGLFAVLLLLPWLDRNPLQPAWRRPYYGPCLAALMLAVGGLFYLGTLPRGLVHDRVEQNVCCNLLHQHSCGATCREQNTRQLRARNANCSGAARIYRSCFPALRSIPIKAAPTTIGHARPQNRLANAIFRIGSLSTIGCRPTNDRSTSICRHSR